MYELKSTWLTRDVQSPSNSIAAALGIMKPMTPTRDFEKFDEQVEVVESRLPPETWVSSVMN